MRTLLSFSFLFLLTSLSGQLIWTDPEFPTANEAVTVFFDATQGTGGLAGCNCDVYIHTGVITSESSGPSDWKHVVTTWGSANAAWKMTPVTGSPDVYSYQITPSVNNFYNIGGGETVEELAMVFRNASGSLEGKATGGNDIFYPIYSDNLEFTAVLTAPTDPFLVKEIGQTINIAGIASQEAAFSLFDNGNLLIEQSGSNFNYELNITTSGSHHVEFKATNGTEEIINEFYYVVPLDNEIEALPEGIIPGINYVDDQTVIFVLEAPGKDNVFLLGDFNEWAISTGYQLKNTPNGEIWWLELNDLSPGSYYTFQYLVDGKILIADPYSTLILDPGNDAYISEETFPNMPDYPIGKTSGIVSVIQPGAPAFDWQATDYQRPEKENLFIYELLMRDFVATHNYQTLKDTLDYLDRLGVNAIELMPINEFDNNESWGYNPTFHGALDKYYGTPEAFKLLVDECHKRGIAIILDVVFNHTHEKNPIAQLYWNNAQFRPAANNPWLNEVAPHNYSVFYDLNHESPYTKRYVKQILKYWLEEYHVDGFRFDLSKGFTQNVGGNFDAWEYDATRIATLKDYADAIWTVSSNAYVILEHFTAHSEEKELADYGMLLWTGFDPHNQYLEAAMGYASNINSISYKNQGFSQPAKVGYMESHDEERMMFKNEQYGNSSGAYNVKDLATGLKRTALAATFFLTIPGPKMMWQFGELGYDYSINYCENGTNNESCRTYNKPIRWDYYQEDDRKDLYNVFSKLAYLKATYPVFQTNDFQLMGSGYSKSIHLNSDDLNITVIGNFNVNNTAINPVFQHTGWWYEYFSGDSLQVNSVNEPISLEAGEYRLYSDERLSLPWWLTATETLVLDQDFPVTLFPNPTSGYFSIRFEKAMKNLTIEVYAINGQRQYEQSNVVAINTVDIAFKGKPGFYWVKVSDGKKVVVKKLVVE